jgi:hypothetical protein
MPDCRRLKRDPIVLPITRVDYVAIHLNLDWLVLVNKLSVPTAATRDSCSPTR